MKRVYAFLIGLLLVGLLGIDFYGFFLVAPLSITGPTIPQEYPIFVMALCLSQVLFIVTMLLGAWMAFGYALREE